MNNTELNRQLLLSHQRKENSWGKILNLLKRQFDAIAIAELAKLGYDDFKMGHMPLLMNIHPEGITNNELAKKAKVTKQAMSKVVKELVQAGYIETEEHGQDKRSAVIVLTTKGKKFVLTVRQRLFDLETEYVKLLGKQKFEGVKESLQQIITYNDERFKVEPI